jgi:hypothetical protein
LLAVGAVWAGLPPLHRHLAEQGEVKLPLWPTPAGVRVGVYTLSVAPPSDPELVSLGGSGGPYLDVIARQAGGDAVVGTVQAIHLFARAGKTAPVLSVWSKTGVSSYVKCRYVPRGRRYCPVWCQDYELDDDGATPVGKQRPFEDCRP